MARSLQRRWLRWPALLAGLVLAAGLALWLALPPVAAFLIERELRRAGFAEASVGADAVHIGPDSVRIDDIVLGPGSSLSGVRLSVPVSTLLRGEAASLRIRAITARAEWTPESGLVVPGYRPAAGPPLTALPVDHVEVDQLSLQLASPYETLEAVGREIAVTAAGPRVSVTGDLRLTAAHGTVRGGVEGDAHLTERMVTVRYAVAGGDAEMQAWRLSGLTGTLSATVGGGRPFRAEVDIRAEMAQWADLALDSPALTGMWQDSRFAGRLRTVEAGATDLDARIAADFSKAVPRLSSAGTLSVNRRDGLSGSVTYDAALTMESAADPLRLSGHLALTAADIRAPGAVADGALSLEAGLMGSVTDLTATFKAPVTGRVTPEAAVLPESLALYAGMPLDFRMQGKADGPLALKIDGVTPAVSGSAALEIAARDGKARLAGDVLLRREAAGIAAAVTDLDLTATALAFEDGTLNTAAFRGKMQTRPGRDWQITGEGRLAASGAVGPVTYDHLRLDWSGAAIGDAEAIRLRPDSCLTAGADAVEWLDTHVRDLAFPCIGTTEGELLAYRPASGEIHFDIETKEQALDMVLVADQKRRITGTWPALAASGRATAAGLQAMTAEMTGGAARLDDLGAMLEDFAGRASLAPDTGLTGDLTVGSVRSLAKPALWAPVSLELEVGRKGEASTFSAFLSDGLGLFVFEAAGEWQGTRGSADLTLYPINFLSGATEIGDLSPRLGTMVSDLSGRVAFDGRLAWGDKLESQGVLTIADLAGRLSAVRFAGLDAEIALTSLLPPATAGRQTLDIDRVVAGMPLTDGRVGLDKPAAGPPAIGPIRFSLAGGTVTADPFILDLSETGETRVTLDVENVDLARMITESGITGLSGTGTLAGRVPVVMSSRGVSIESGGLRAVSTGALSYTPDELPRFLQGDDQRARMLRQVLRNFQYSDLSVSLAGAVGGDTGQKVTLAAKGSNPDFLDGHPVELNFNFEGALLGALKSAVSIGGMERLQRLFEKQEGQGTE